MSKTLLLGFGFFLRLCGRLSSLLQFLCLAFQLLLHGFDADFMLCCLGLGCGFLVLYGDDPVFLLQHSSLGLQNLFLRLLYLLIGL